MSRKDIYRVGAIEGYIEKAIIVIHAIELFIIIITMILWMVDIMNETTAINIKVS